MKTAVALLSVAVGASAFAPSASISKASGLKAAADFEGVIGSDSLETGKRMVGYMHDACRELASSPYCTPRLDLQHILTFASSLTSSLTQ
jgi:hypothetical protein